MKHNLFKDKVIVITGASGGVGRATAWEFAKQGAKVVLLARSREQLQAAKREVEQLGGQGLIIPADVADAAAVEAAADLAEQTFGPIDVWVNNAMNSVFAPITEVTAEEYKRVTEVTYLGYVYGTKAALKRMKPRNSGSIVFVGSALAYRGIPLQSAYCGAKHAMEGFFDSLRTELLHDRSPIKTCMVHLPALNTTQFKWVLNKLPHKPRPMGKVYQPEVAARAIVFAAAHNRRSVWVGFPTFKAIMGNALAPWYADWVLARNAYKGQQTGEPVDAGQKNNVWEPVPGDQGTYGDFGHIATNRSFTVWATMNRGLVRTVTGLVAAGLLLAFTCRRK
jgi:NAD(P)-dependent dehydrogenase (short-subunit alcohol dehydrogenase family)